MNLTSFKLYSRDDLTYIMFSMLQGMRHWAGIECVNWTEVDGDDMPKSITAHDWNDPERGTSGYVIQLNDVERTIERVRGGHYEIDPIVREDIVSGDPGMVDATAGDVLAQLICFGELRYEG